MFPKILTNEHSQAIVCQRGNILRVNVKRANLTRDVNKFSPMNPGVIIRVGSMHEFKTEVVKDGGKNPIYDRGDDDMAEFKLNNKDVFFVDLEVFNKDINRFKVFQKEDEEVGSGRSSKFVDLIHAPNFRIEETVELTFNEKAAGTVDIVMWLELHNIVPPKMKEYWLNEYTEKET